MFSFPKKNHWSRLLEYTNNPRQHLIKVGLTAIVATIFEIAAMIFVVIFLSEISTSDTAVKVHVSWIKNEITTYANIYFDGDFLMLNVIMIVIFLILRELFSFLNIYFNRVGMSQVELNLRTKLLHSVMLADYQAADKIGSGPFVEMAGLASVESGKLLQMGMQRFKLAIVVLTYFATLFYSFPILGFLGLSIGGLVLFLMSFSLVKVKSLSADLTTCGLNFSQRAERTYALRRSLKIDQLVKFELIDIKKNAQKLFDLSVGMEIISTATRSVVSTLLFIALFGSIFVLLKIGYIDIVLISAGVVLVMRLTPLMLGLARLRTGIAMKVPLFDAVDSTIKLLLFRSEANNGTELVFQKPQTLTVKKLSYSYPETPNKVLNNISFELNSGETIALVGPSGAGKTTLVNILVRLLAPTDGRVFLDGREIDKFQLDNYRSNFCYALQQPIVFDATVLQNLTMRSKHYDLIELTSLLKATKLAEFIDKLPDGLDTIIGERGVKLSGGQQQRIGIVSALLKRANVCIFDEPTSALDANNQSQIVKLIRQRTAKNKTITIVISHNWSVVQNFDRMIVLDIGKIIYDGKPSFQKFFET